MKTTQTNIAVSNNNRTATMIRNLRNVLGGALILAITLSSCKKPEKEQEDTEKPDGVALTKRFESNRDDATQTFVIDIEAGAMVTGDQGTRVIFPANSLGLGGVAVTGNVDVELIEIYGKSSMVLQNMPTTGIKPDGTHEILKSGGEFFLNARQYGNQLEILIPITIKSKDFDPAEWEAMNIFRAGDDKDDTDLWEEVNEDGDEEGDAANAGEGEGPAGGYVMFNYFDTSSFGWTNLDRWYNYSGELTEIFVDVPDGFDGDNCEVFLSYDGEANALARMDIYNSTTELFTEHYGRIPVGQEVHLILVAEIDGVMHYTIQGTTVVEDHVEVMAAPVATTQSDLETLINALP